MTKHWVYRAYDEEGYLLYVGCSCQPKMRLDSHKYSSEWYDFATAFTFVEYESKDKARAAEAIAIEREGPTFNLIGNPNRKRDGHHFVGTYKWLVKKQALENLGAA